MQNDKPEPRLIHHSAFRIHHFFPVFIRVAETLSGLLLLGTCLLPFQNYEQMKLLAAGMILLWILASLLGRSTRLLTTNLFFHFSIILAFTLRIGSAHGQLTGWFTAEAFTQWVAVLWIAARQSPDGAAPSLFLITVLISPLHFAVLDGYTPPGIPIWTLLVIRTFVAITFTRTGNRRPLPPSLWVLLGLSLLSIPFCLYPGGNLQFLLVNAGLVLIYYSISNSSEGDRWALTVGYGYLAAVLVLFGLRRESFLLEHLGMQALRFGLAIVMDHNDVIPVLLIAAGFLLDARMRSSSRALRRFLALEIGYVTLLIYLAYSRLGWFCVPVFMAGLILKTQQRKVRWLMLSGCGVLALTVVATLLPATWGTSRFRGFSILEDRQVSWMTGVRTIAGHPLWGAGWNNFYAHTRLSPQDTVLTDLHANEAVRPLPSRSLFLDLGESAGIPFMIAFLVFLMNHFRRAKECSPVLVALLAAVIVNALFDSAFFRLTNLPHLWILLAVIAGRSSQPARQLQRPAPAKVLTLALFLVGGVIPLAGDYLLQKAVSLHRISSDEEAMKLVAYSQRMAPLDVEPLEQLKEIYLAAADTKRAAMVLRNLMVLKKDYPPYFAELGRIQRIEGLNEQSRQNLLKAKRLDPYAVVADGLYVDLALLAQKENRTQEFEETRSLAFVLAWNRGLEFQARQLLPSEDTAFVERTLALIDRKTVSRWDWLIAVDHFHSNLIKVHQDVSGRVLIEQAIRRLSRLTQQDIDYFCVLLSGHYARTRDIWSLVRVSQGGTEETNCLIRARLETLIGNFSSATADLQKALKYNRYESMDEVLKNYYSAFKQYDGLRTHYRIMETLTRFPGSDYQRGIGDSFLAEGKYKPAAREYRRLSYYDYSDPNPHWMEARAWWLAGDRGRAGQANERMIAVVGPNRFLSELYRTEINFPHGVGVVRGAIPNSCGGTEFRTGIFAHPPSRIIFQSDTPYPAFRGRIGLIWGAWEYETDGVRFEIGSPDSPSNVSVYVGPRSSQNWIPFEWKPRQASKAVIFQTGCGGNCNYDWALWAIE